MAKKNVDMIIIGQISDKSVLEHFTGASFTQKQESRANYFVGHGGMLWAVSCQQARSFTSLHYGMVPFWSREAVYHYESPVEGSENPGTENSKKRIILHPNFRRPIRENRCLIPADYVLVTNEDGNPYLFYLPNQQPLAVAGVYDKWKEDYHQPEFYRGFSVLTETAPEAFQSHGIQRLPLILSERQHKQWLSKETTLAEITQILGASQKRQLNAFPISLRLFQEQRNDSSLCRPAGNPIMESAGDSGKMFSFIRAFRSKRTAPSDAAFQMERAWKE